MVISVIIALSYADYSPVNKAVYKNHYYYQIEPNGQWYWSDTVDDAPPTSHCDIDYYVDHIGYDYMGNMVKLIENPIYVGSDHSH